MSDTDTPAYDAALERFKKEHGVDVQATREREPWSLAAAKRRLSIPPSRSTSKPAPSK